MKRYMHLNCAIPRMRRLGQTPYLNAKAATTMVIALGLGLPAGAQARTSCAFAGAPANVLTVSVSGESDAVITRRGPEISVQEYGDPPEPCAGGVPTVTNTDTITIAFGGDTSPTAEVLLANGPMAPGASTEAVGAPEIEIVITGVGNNVDIVGTSGDDAFRWGPGGANPGLNLNPDSAADQDVDVVELGASAPLLFAEGAGGNDTFTGDRITRGGYVYADGGPGNDVITAPAGNAGAIFESGSGNDVLTGSRRADVLRGEAGNDRIAGGAGADNITGGPGRDRITSGPGRDFVKVRDNAHDTVSCGTGRDRVNTDRRDRVNACEVINGR